MTGRGSSKSRTHATSLVRSTITPITQERRGVYKLSGTTYSMIHKAEGTMTKINTEILRQLCVIRARQLSRGIAGSRILNREPLPDNCPVDAQTLVKDICRELHIDPADKIVEGVDLEELELTIMRELWQMRLAERRREHRLKGLSLTGSGR